MTSNRNLCSNCIAPGVSSKVLRQVSLLSTSSEALGLSIPSQVFFLPDRENRAGIFLGLLAGGPAAVWYVYLLTCLPDTEATSRSSYIISMIFMWITAAVLAEICSALPLSGSIYIWAAESAGPKYGRFFGFVVAWWSTTAWMTFAAGNCQVGVTVMLRTMKYSLYSLDDSKLHRFAACNLGSRFPRRGR